MLSQDIKNYVKSKLKNEELLDRLGNGRCLLTEGSSVLDTHCATRDCRLWGWREEMRVGDIEEDRQQYMRCQLEYVIYNCGTDAVMKRKAKSE